MQVNPAISGAVAGVSGQRGPAKAPGDQDNSPSSAGSSVLIKPGAQGQGNGAIRLLQEGHFQGVAGVRLQINFHEQLSGITQQSVASTADAGAETVLAAVDAVVAEFVGGNDLDDSILEGITAAQQAFTEAATALFEEFQVGAIGRSELLASLQTAFDDFLQSIEAVVPAGGSSADEGGELVVQIEPESGNIEGVIPTGGEVIPVEQTEDAGEEPVEVDSPDFTAFLNSLSDAFSGALKELESALASAETTVPKIISEPNGNGVAFEKFLNILNALQGGDETGVTSSSDPQIDTAG